MPYWYRVSVPNPSQNHELLLDTELVFCNTKASGGWLVEGLAANVSNGVIIVNIVVIASTMSLCQFRLLTVVDVEMSHFTSSHCYNLPNHCKVCALRCYVFFFS